MNKRLRAWISLFSLHQGVRFAKIFALVLVFGFASWRVIDGAHRLVEGDEKATYSDPSDLFSVEDPLSHLRALLLFKSHCQVNQTSDLAKITWLLSSAQPLYLKLGTPITYQGMSLEYKGSYPGLSTSIRMVITSGDKSLEVALPIENAPLVTLSQQQLQMLNVSYLGLNLLPQEEAPSGNASPGNISTGSTSAGNISSNMSSKDKAKDPIQGVLEDLREQRFYFVTNSNLLPSNLFEMFFPRSVITSVSFQTDRATFELFDDKGFLMKIELRKAEAPQFAKDYFKHIQLERVTFGAALVNFKQVRIPIKLGRAYLFNDKGCIDLTDKQARARYMKGELLGQVVVFQGMNVVGTKKEAKFEIIDTSRTREEERVVIHEAKRMDMPAMPRRPAQKAPQNRQQAPRPKPSGTRPTGNRSLSTPQTSNLFTVPVRGWFI